LAEAADAKKELAAKKGMDTWVDTEKLELSAEKADVADVECLQRR
jgi:hypothetical protein